MTAKPVPVVRETWLDGLRGIAALIVAWYHMTSGKLNTPYRSFWDTPASENRHLIQLYPFRLFFAGPGMVDIFFVVSGYSVSTGLIKLRNEHESTSLVGFYQKLSSSVVRRMFRLCFPVLAMSVVSHLLFYAGLYTIPFAKGTGCPGAKPWGNPGPHVKCLVRSFVGIVNVEGYQNLTLNDHFWTIPVEIRGSMQVYLTLLALANMKERMRVVILGMLCVRSWWNGSAEFIAFFAGVLFAELNASASLEQHKILTHKSLPHDTGWLSASKTRRDRLWTLSKYLVFVVGVYLLSLPIPNQSGNRIGADFSPDWFFLKFVPPLSGWSPELTMRTWHTFGAILVVGCMRVLPRLRAPFETRVAQFLGHISFSMYLCHQTILRIMLHWCLHWIGKLATGMNYFEAYRGGKWGKVFVAWMLTIPLILGVLLSTSTYMARAVDRRSIALGFYIERRLRSSWK